MIESNNTGSDVFEKVFLGLIIIFIPFFIIGLFLEGILVIIGLIFAIAGILGYKTPRTEPELGETWKGNFKSALKKKSILVIMVFAVGWGIVYLYNLSTFPPYGPLYYIREAELMKYHPGIPVDELPSKSTFGFFGLIMDTGILIIFAYVVYMRIKPGKQQFEDIANTALSRTWFIAILLLSSIVHIIGHLPLELYGRGQWGTGYETLIAWIGYDKFAHFLGSAVITMLFATLFIKYVLNSECTQTSKMFPFLLVTSIAFMMMVGVLWEFFEWGADYALNLGHFVDEILDTPKDLVWDFIGAVTGAILSYFDLRK